MSEQNASDPLVFAPAADAPVAETKAPDGVTAFAAADQRVCAHHYRDHDRPCPQPVPVDATCCLWHNPAVRKDDAYVPELLKQADRVAAGDLAEYRLMGLDWPGATLAGRNLRCADLRDARLARADLTGTDLTGAVLRRTDLRAARLVGAHLAGADLSDCNLMGADLSDADLTGAIIDGTWLMGADLSGADLTGAEIHGFRWNHRTCFARVKGFEPRPEGGTEGPTQAFPTPLAEGMAQSPASQLDADADALRTRIFVVTQGTGALQIKPRPATTIIAKTAAQAAPAAVVELSRGRAAWRAYAVAAGVALVTGVAGVLLGHAWAPAASSDRALAAKLDTAERACANLASQHEADLAAIRSEQERSRRSEAERSTVSQQLALRSAELEAVRRALREAECDATRRQGAEDQAALLGLTVSELEHLNGDLARHGSRQERLGRVLAEGAERVERERHEMAAKLERNRVDQQRLVVLDQEVRTLSDQLSGLTKERDAQTALNRKLAGELLAAQRDIERYLARLGGTSLQDVLTGARESAPLMAVTAGTPVALSGDYLMTLRVDPGATPGSIQTRIVVQRPPSAANPEVTVVLYDADQRPLRRLSFSFPHVDRGAPLVSSTTLTACDRFPAFARVQVVPGLDEVTAAR